MAHPWLIRVKHGGFQLVEQVNTNSPWLADLREKTWDIQAGLDLH